MASKFISKGVETIQEAVNADNNNDLATARTLYANGIKLLMTGKKYEKNDRAKEAITQKIKNYLKRAEEIEEILNNPTKEKKKKQKKTTGGDGSSDEEDEEENKLKKSLGSAIVREKPNVKWSDVAGLETAKALLQEAVILPVAFGHFFTGKREPWKGILLYGPPGTGKSYLAKAVATEANGSTFFSVSSADLVSKYVGESEKLVKNLFEMAEEEAPSIIFIDEIDSLASKRTDGEADNTRRIKTEFLVRMQGVGNESKGVLTLGATNCPWDLDAAIRRRFQKRIYIPLPGPEARQVMFKIHIGTTRHNLQEHDHRELALRSEGFSGSDISNVVKDALMEPIRTLQAATHFIEVDHPDQPGRGLCCCSPSTAGAIEMSLMTIPANQRDSVIVLPITVADFYRVLASAKGSVGDEDIQRHVEWTSEYGQEG